MKNTIYTSAAIFLIGGLSYFNQPWWLVAVGGFVSGAFFAQHSGKAYATAFAAGFALWWGYAMFLSSVNGGVLAAKVGEIFMGLKSWQLLSITGTLGGLLAGFGALAGLYGRRLIFKV